MMPRPFEEVVDEHGHVVMRVIQALVGPADADDAWSETFLAALTAYPRLRADSNVRGWLVTIAHRKAIDQLRGTNRRPRPTGSVPEQPVMLGAAALDRDPDLWRALEALPFKQRAAVALHHIAGLPYGEVGVLIESSEVAARRSAADGIASLRKSYRRGEAS
jgi:RNA polymerase sigma factor (sigma-70 family)